jgi:hypothetical protein
VVLDAGRSPSSPSQEKKMHETQRKRYYPDRNGGLKEDFLKYQELIVFGLEQRIWMGKIKWKYHFE